MKCVGGGSRFGGGQGEHVPDIWQLGDRLSDDPLTPHFGMEKNNVFQYLFAFYSHLLLDLPGPHVLTLYQNVSTNTCNKVTSFSL